MFHVKHSNPAIPQPVSFGRLSPDSVYHIETDFPNRITPAASIGRTGDIVQPRTLTQPEMFHVKHLVLETTTSTVKSCQIRVPNEQYMRSRMQTTEGEWKTERLTEIDEGAEDAVDHWDVVNSQQDDSGDTQSHILSSYTGQ